MEPGDVRCDERTGLERRRYPTFANGSRMNPTLLRRYAPVALLVLLVTLMHYNTAMHLHGAHGIYRRLYYFPIILAAFRGGWVGGLMTALLSCVVYFPHAIGKIGHDPGSELEKSLEMGLYVAVGLVCGILVTRRDRTLVQLEQTAVRLSDTLEEKQNMETELLRQARLAAVGRLSAGLAHEIRNPLASIKGAAEILADDADEQDPKAKLLRILKVEAVRLNEVLTRFLAFARPSDHHRERFDASVETHEVVELLRHRSKGTVLTGPELGSPACHLHGDREQFRQLLINLVLNGIEAAGEGGTVAVRVYTRSDAVVCEVEDDGPGFSPESLNNLGTPFYTTKDDGTGLGLAICHRIIEDHGGTLRVDQERSHGSRVVVELPSGEGD